MAENTLIEWAHHTFNPWIGCTNVGPGCDHCYAEAMMDKRYGRVEWGPHGARSRTSAPNWKQPLKWDRDAAKAGTRPRVFCASLADVFDNHASVLPEWRADLWALIRATPNLDWLLLTKRPGNIVKMLPPDWGNGYPNVWLGCTVVNQAEADRDIPKLLDVPAAVRFLSMEPLLGPVDLRRWIGTHPYIPGASTHIASDGFERQDIGGGILDGLDWVIAGGESGPKARPMHPDWARSLRDQCAAAGVAYFHKQNGEYQVASHANGHFDSDMSRNGAVWVDGADGTIHSPSSLGLTNPIGMIRVGKARAGRLLDGREHNDMPGVTHG